MSKLESPSGSTAYNSPELVEQVQAIADSQAQGIPREGDPLAMVAEEDLDRRRVAVQIQHLRGEVRQANRLNWVRIILIGALFLLVVIWLFVLQQILKWQGFSSSGFRLSDKVLIAYITSTTVSVLGLFHIAAKWLFSGTVETLNRMLLESSKDKQQLAQKADKR